MWQSDENAELSGKYVKQVMKCWAWANPESENKYRKIVLFTILKFFDWLKPWWSLVTIAMLN